MHFGSKQSITGQKSECSDTIVPSCPTRTVKYFLGTSCVQERKYPLTFRIFISNQKAMHVKFSPCQGPEQIQQELSKYCSEKQNKTKFSLVDSSRFLLVENIQLCQSSKIGLPERGKIMWCPGCTILCGDREQGCPQPPLLGLWSLSPLHSLREARGFTPCLPFCPVTPPQFMGSQYFQNPSSSPAHPNLRRLCPSSVFFL